MIYRRRVITLLLAAGLGVAACGQQPPDTITPAGPGSPGDAATSTTLPSTTMPSPTGTPTFGGDAGSRLVTPKPGTVQTRPIPWQDSKPRPDGRSVRIYYTSGVEPCHVLDHVKVTYLAERVLVTLYEGSDASSKRQICIELAEFKMVDVQLDQPIGNRTVGDGAPR